MADFFDIAFSFDPSTRRCDLQLGEDGDLAIDETPATPMLISYGSDRRARADDDLPAGLGELNRPVSFVERRGWAGDALDLDYRRIGSRLWLLDRAKEWPATTLMCAEWLREAFAWVQSETGEAAVIEVTWVAPQMLGTRVVVDGRPISRTIRIGGGA